MDEVYTWVEDKRKDEGRKAFFSFLSEQRQIWTPSHIFNQCCVKWLADGDPDLDEDDDGYFDEYSCRNGCDGSRCDRDHPRITLRFDASDGATVATVSHRLGPLLQYFNRRVSEGTAWPHGSTEYQLNGYIRENLTDMCSQDEFGGHLVKIKQGSLDASDSAQRGEQEQEEREKKRQRVGEHGRNEPFALFEETFDIVTQERLQVDLENDFMSLFCLRSATKYLKKVATTIALKKITTLSLSLTPLADGMERFGEDMDKLDGYDTETWDISCWDPPEGVVAYEKRAKIDFVFREAEDSSPGGAYYPVDTTASTFTWKSGKLRLDCDEDDAYSGQLMRAYWHPSQVDPVDAPARLSMYGQAKPTLGILLGEFHVKKHPDLARTTRVRENGVTLEYKVFKSTAEEEAVEGEEGESERLVEYEGEIETRKMKVDFGFLVGQHAKEIKWKLTNQYREIKKQRPLMESELTYMKLVENAAQSVSNVPSLM
mmetsp:Transcript_28218/g.40894  ORF Transcript_28218/g.40894 Transcript_28218/m.40894 type:complete len:485 (-) Transcript_28218:114-1568(-)